MQSKAITTGILKALAILAGIVLLVAFIYKIQSVLIYITIAAVVSLIGRPIVLFLRRKLKFPNLLAVLITMIIVYGTFLGIMALFIPLIVEQGQNLSLLDINGLKENLQSLFGQIQAYFEIQKIDLTAALENFDWSSTFSFSAIPNLLNGIFGTMGSLSIGLFSIIFISFFFLKDSAMLNRAILSVVKTGQESRFTASFTKIKDLLSRYFLGLLLQITVLFVIYTVVLLVFGIKNAFVIAFLCALLNLIPYIGPLVGGVLLLILSMTSNLDSDFQTVILPTTIKIMVGYIIAQLIDNFVSQPLIFSNSVKSHPLEIFLVIITAGLLFGITGMIVAVPGYTAIKVMAQEFLGQYKVVKSLTKDL